MTATPFYRIAFTSLLLLATIATQARDAFAQTPATEASSAPLRAEISPPHKSTSSTYVIGDGDLLAINVWNEPDFKQSFPVRPDGKITLPLIGSLQAAGTTPSQLEATIATRLEAFIHNPNVTVMVMTINSRKFNILGRVARPGSYPLSGNITVLDAIAQAGGLTPFAKVTHIYVLRKASNGSETRLPFNSLLSKIADNCGGLAAERAG
ncbi:MAG: polysaccharide biosynthesis/export family protein [Acidobacteriaceae bacterium]